MSVGVGIAVGGGLIGFGLACLGSFIRDAAGLLAGNRDRTRIVVQRRADQ